MKRCWILQIAFSFCWCFWMIERHFLSYQFIRWILWKTMAGVIWDGFYSARCECENINTSFTIFTTCLTTIQHFFCFLFFNAFLLIFWSKIFLYAYQWVTLKEEFQVKIELIVNFDIVTRQKHINLSSLQRYLYEFVFILPKWARIRFYFNKMSTFPCLF